MKLRVESSESKATGSKLSRFQALQLNRLCCKSVDQMPEGKTARVKWPGWFSPVTSHRSPVTAFLRRFGKVLWSSRTSD
jgi:hypothetical protein